MNRNKDKELCPYCRKLSYLTKHHILPKRWFFGKGAIHRLCRKCHDWLEKDIAMEEKLKGQRLDDERYYGLARKYGYKDHMSDDDWYINLNFSVSAYEDTQ